MSVLLAGRDIAGQAYLGVDHEAKHILNTIKGKDATICAFPETFVVGTSTLDGRPELVDVLRVCDSDLEESGLPVALEAEQVLALDYLD